MGSGYIRCAWGGRNGASISCRICCQDGRKSEGESNVSSTLHLAPAARPPQPPTHLLHSFSPT